MMQKSSSNDKKRIPKAKEKGKKRVTIAKGVKISPEKAKEIKKKPGGSNIGKYKTVKPSEFAGSIPGTFPINTVKRARNALSRAHLDKNPSAVNKKVHRKYPSLSK